MMKKIENSWSLPGGVSSLSQDNQDQITDLLLGRSVTNVEGEHLELDNGTVVRVVPNEGGCACSAGDYELEYLNRVDNVITKVEFDYKPTDDGSDYQEAQEYGYYRIFVLAGHERVNLLSVTGDDGNGYYGTGFQLLIRPARH